MRRFRGIQFSNELRNRFFSLVDALSALRLLMEEDLQSVTEEVLVSNAMKTLIQHADFDQCAIYLQNHGVFQPIACARVDDDDIFQPRGQSRGCSPAPLPRLTPEDPAVAAIVNGGQIDYCRNCEGDARYQAFREASFGFDGGAMLALPIQVGGEVLGVFFAAHPLPEYFEPWHQQMLVLYCAALGKLLHHHRLLCDLKTEVERRTAELEQALTESRRLTRHYKELASLDELTGLHNRRYFFEEGSAALARAQRYGGGGTLLLMDIDNFQQINETLGQAQGDTLLGLLGDGFRREARLGDILCRVGGDAFALLATAGDAEQAGRIATRFHEVARALPLEVEGMERGLNLSMGVSVWPHVPDGDPATLLEQFYAQADTALYTSKSTGQDRCTFFREDLVRRSA